MDMVRNGNDNTAIATKVHQWTSALLRVKDPFDLPEAVVSGIRTLFDVPQAACACVDGGWPLHRRRLHARRQRRRAGICLVADHAVLRPQPGL